MLIKILPPLIILSSLLLALAEAQSSVQRPVQTNVPVARTESGTRSFTGSTPSVQTTIVTGTATTGVPRPTRTPTPTKNSVAEPTIKPVAATPVRVPLPTTGRGTETTTPVKGTEVTNTLDVARTTKSPIVTPTVETGDNAIAFASSKTVTVIGSVVTTDTDPAAKALVDPVPKTETGTNQTANVTVPENSTTTGSDAGTNPGATTGTGNETSNGRSRTVNPKEFLDAHNKYRTESGLSPLVWNVTLAEYAREYGEVRAVDCELIHSQGRYGENLFRSLRGHWTPTMAVEAWVGEKANYNEANKTCAPEKMCGHYTQVMWRSTARVGCARMACDKNAGFMYICSYDPPGNYEGEGPFDLDQIVD